MSERITDSIISSSNTTAITTFPSKSTSFEPVLPLELLDESIGKVIVIIMRDHQQFQGTLTGFDDYVSKNFLLSLFYYISDVILNFFH